MEFWTVQRLEEFAAVLKSGRHRTVGAAFAEFGEAYDRPGLSRGSMRARFQPYFGVSPSAMLVVPQRDSGFARKTDPLASHGFAENASAPTLQSEKTAPEHTFGAIYPIPGEPVPKSLAFLADVHLDPCDEPCPAWTCAKRFVGDAQPEFVVLGGDFLHMRALSHWDMSKRRLVEGRRYLEEVEFANRELDELQGMLPSSKFVFMEGNHEAWVKRYVDENPECEGVMDLRSNLWLAGRGIRWIEENDVLKVGKLRFIHGWYHNQHHARKTVAQLGASVMYGHVHKPQLYTLEQRARGQLQGISVGCLCNLNPSYRRGQPTNWLHGFGFVEYRESGEFQATSISIVNGAMTFAGETWRG